LTVVLNTVKSHEGYVNVKSCEEGTQFELFFPITMGHPSSVFSDFRIPTSDFKSLSSVLCSLTSAIRLLTLSCPQAAEMSCPLLRRTMTV